MNDRTQEPFSLPPIPLDPPFLNNNFNADLGRRGAEINLGVKRIHTMGVESSSYWAWRDLVDKKQSLKSLFVEANKVVNENKASISRFYEIIREQKTQKLKLEKELLDTKADIEEYLEVKETMEKYVREYSIFEDFLERVVGESKTGDLFSIRDVLNRYETLEGTRADLVRILKSEMEEEAHLRRQMIDIVEEKSATIKSLGNRLVMLQIARRQSLDRRIYWEMMVQRIKNLILARTEAGVALHEACWDLYTEICRQRNVLPTASEKDTNAQLDYIQKSIAFYKEVLTIASGSMAKPQENNNNKVINRRRKKKL